MPKKLVFSNGDDAVNVKTVGQVIDELSCLPREMKVGGYGEESSVDIVIFNQKYKSIHVSFEEGGEWTELKEEDEEI